MNIKYDSQVDAKYIQIKTGVVSRTEIHNDWLNFDYDNENNILGIEVLDASKNYVTVVTEGDNVVACLYDSPEAKVESFINEENSEFSNLRPRILVSAEHYGS